MNKSLSILFILICSLFGASISAQSTDSLRTLLGQALPDSSRARILVEIAEKIHYRAPRECLEMAREAAELSTAYGESLTLTRAILNQAVAQNLMGEYEAGKTLAEQSIAMARHLGDRALEYRCRRSAASAFDNLRQYDQAIQQIDTMIELGAALEDTRMVNIAYASLAETYQKARNPAAAQEIYLQLFQKALAQQDTLRMTTIYSGLIDPVELPPEMESIVRGGWRMGMDKGGVFLEMAVNQSLGKFLLRAKNDPVAALPFLEKYATYAQQIQTPNDLVKSALYLGDCWRALGELGPARSAYQQAAFFTPSSIEETGVPLVMELQISRARLEQQAQQYQTAFRYLDEAYQWADSINRADQLQMRVNAETRYNLAQKETEIAENQLEIARQGNARQRLIGGGILLIGLLAGSFQFFFSRQRNRKQQVEQKLAQEQAEAERLRELDELKTQFFTNVSHELRTPLTLITSPLEESLKELKQVNLENKLQLAYTNSKRLLSLTNEILDLAKLEAGHLQLDASTFLVLPRVSRLLAAFQSQAETKQVGLQLKAEIDEGLKLTTSPKALDTILNNLIANAIKFTPKGGRVQLYIQQHEDQLQLNIQDSGPGIHPEDLPFLFDRFYQSRHPKNSEGGTGIGLALSKQLADRINASLTVASQNEQGSCFTLQLPLTTQSTNLTALSDTLGDVVNTRQIHTNSSQERTPVSTSKADDALAPLVNPEAKILIVEDHPDMSNYLIDSLQKHYQCFQANNGQEALKILHQQSIDLILSDVMMPEMDGFELRVAINNLEQFSRIPFILLTARSLEADKLRGLHLGVDDYITKPFSLPELEARLANLLRNKLSREEEWGNETPSSQGEQILRDIYDYVQERLDDTSWGVVDMAKDLGYSQRHLARLVGPITGLSLVQLILEIRLQTAFKLLREKAYPTVTEVRFAVGIESASYFSRKYKERFGVSPGTVIEN